jgi:hypothetical protein
MKKKKAHRHLQHTHPLTHAISKGEALNPNDAVPKSQLKKNNASQASPVLATGTGTWAQTAITTSP